MDAIQELFETPGMCRTMRLAEQNLETYGLSLKDVLRGAIAIADMGGTQEQINAFAADCGRGEAKPIDAYL